MRISASLFLVALSGALPLPAAANEGSGYYEREPDGYYWYDDPNEDAPETRTPAATTRPADGPTVPFSTAWLRKNLDTYRDRAIDDPSPRNTAIFAYLQRLTLDRAERFAQSLKLTTQMDPALDEAARRPFGNAAASLVDAEADQASRRALKAIGEGAGIWFFYGSQCPYCVAEIPVLETMERTYGVPIYPISLDGLPLPGGAFPRFVVDAGQAQRLGVVGTPSLFLVRPPGDVVPLAQGQVALDELIERTLRAAHAKGWIDEATWRSTRSHRSTYLTDYLTADVEQTAEDPDALLSMLREASNRMLNGESANRSPIPLPTTEDAP